jgi:hypothetical protein
MFGLQRLFSLRFGNLDGYGCFPGCVDLQEFVEEGAVLEHGGAHVFGGDLGGGGALGDGVGGAVVIDDAGMVDRDVGGALFEVGDGVAAGLHEGGDEIVGLNDRAAGMVDEAGLDDLPVGEEALAFGGGKVTDVEVVDALFTRGEGGLGVAFGAALEDGAVILGTKAGAEMLGLLFALIHNDGNYNGDDHDKSDDGDDESWVRWIELHGFSLLRGVGCDLLQEIGCE